MDTETLTIAVTAIATYTAFLASLASALEEDSPPRGPQQHFHRTALICLRTSPSITAWHQLLSAGSSSNFIPALNFDKRVFFETLLPLFAKKRQNLSFGSPYRRAPKSRGQPSSVSTEDVLGLTLWRLKSSERQSQLRVIFGLISSAVSNCFNYGICVLHRTLKRQEQPALRLQRPTLIQMKESAKLLEVNRPNCALLRGIFAVVDGGRFSCAEYVDADTHNTFYESYACTVDVTNLLFYYSKGEIILAAVNYPGVCHDSKLANLSGLVFSRLKDAMTPPGFSILGVSAFVTRNINGNIV